MAERFVPVISLTQFTGSNQDDLPLASYVDAYGPDTGVIEVDEGILTISWPGIGGSVPFTIQTGDWVDAAGTVYPADEVATRYVRLSDLGGLL